MEKADAKNARGTGKLWKEWQIKEAICASTPALVIALIVSLTILIGGLSNTIVHGTFALNNPDKNAVKEDCWAVWDRPDAMTE